MTTQLPDHTPSRRPYSTARVRAAKTVVVLALIVVVVPVLIAAIGAGVVGLLEHEPGDWPILQPIALALTLLAPFGFIALVLGIVAYALGARIGAVVVIIVGLAYALGGGIIYVSTLNLG